MVISKLCELADKHGTDKKPENHNYTPFYNLFFADYKPRKVLEIGVANGASLRMWAEYFPDAEIWGLDINDCSSHDTDRIKSIRGDQKCADDLDKLLSTIGVPIDIIIEDASHNKDDQVFSALYLAKYLSAGGYYIIEDIDKDAREFVYDSIRKELYPGFAVSQIETTDPQTDSRLVVIRRV